MRTPAACIRLHALALATVVCGGASLGCLGDAPPIGGGTGATTGTGGEGSSANPTTETTGPLPPATACLDYLECVAMAAPEQLPAAEAEYGEAGRCWSDAALADQCAATCITEREALCPEGTAGGTGDMPLLCSIEGLLPGSPSPVEVGDGVEVLPPAIGEVLERNCGCHYVDPRALDPTTPAYFGAMPMATWSDFHGSFMGQLVWQRVQQRAVVELNMPPPYFCDELDMGSLSIEDHALLQAWLGAGAPDAATWDG